MNCAGCGRANRAGARFCGGCGASLARRCPACGAECEPDLRFCDACGAPLAGRPAEPSVQRKVVTIVFADLIGSTALHERLDPESVRRIMEGYHGAVRAPVEAHGGSVVQLLGDGVMCAFGIPRVAEDDALRAVRAAGDVQRAFREFLHEHPELAGRVGLRVAVNTGEVVVSDDYAAGIGDPLNVAARLQQEAKDGDVLIGGATQRFVADRVTLAPVGSFALKGRAEPVAAYRVVSLEPPAPATATAFVGRDSELRRIALVYEAAVAAPAARLAVVLGSPGLGKSRLAAEFSRDLAGRASVLVAQCHAAGRATFAPLADALRTALASAVLADEAERAQITAGIEAILAEKPALPEETFFAVRRLLAALAAEQPVVLVIDDLQWAEPLLLDLVEHLVQWGAGVPLLVLAAARPELRDARSSLTTPGPVAADVLTLGGLDASAATRLAASVIGADALPAAVAGRVLATSEGNPFFLGELVRMLVNDGALRREGERWVTAVALADLDMPPTIQALLAARLERLRPEERLVLERAAVVGRQFSRAAVAHLLPREAQADLDARLESLRRSELIEPDSGWFLGEPALRFHHVLIRDAAYRRPLRDTRAELHARFAEWLTENAGPDPALQDEMIGWHLEQSFQHRRELGALDASSRELGARAARHLANAGRRALARDDLPPATSLLGRALDCLDAGDPARAELALDWSEALLAGGDVGTAASALAELARLTESSERMRAWQTCFHAQLAVLSDPQALHASADAVAAAAETLAQSGDAAGEAKAHQVHALVLAQLGKIAACEAALDRALAAARRANDRRRANAVLAGAPVAALWGPSPVTRASGRCLDVVRVLRITQGAPAVEAVALRCQAVLETLRGRSDAARRMIASSRRMVEELGITQRVLEAGVFAGLIELLEGDGAAAEGQLRPAYTALCEQGLGIDAAQAAALLGRALLVQGRADEAEALSHESEALAGDSFKAAIAWRGVRAEALAARGEHTAAVEVARKAVEIAAATDDLLDHADARQALSLALRAAGRRSEADAEAERAVELWREKGATLLVERARGDPGRVAPMARAAEGRPSRPVHRSVTENAATVNAGRLDAAFAAREADVFPTLLAEGMEVVHHPTGVVYDRAGTLATWHSLLRAEEVAYASEPLATLGDGLALCRRSSRSLGGLPAWRESDDERGSFGAAESEHIVLIEVDAQGLRRRVEVFSCDHLGDAVARLYERYAELQPEGPEHARAGAQARTLGTLLGPVEPESWATGIDPAVEFVDHRPLGLGSNRGADSFLRMLRTLPELAADVTIRTDDVIAVGPSALLLRMANFGTVRVSGGAFERDWLWLVAFGPAGLAAQLEMFAEMDADAALARFEALAAERPPPARRRVPPNAATANVARLDMAIAARDEAALADLFSDPAEAVHHPTGVTYDREGLLASARSLLGARDTRLAHEPLATLGDSLALCRRRTSFCALAEGDVAPFGVVERDDVVLVEVDARGAHRRAESFATDHLGDAIARLYERYAELLPAGTARIRAEGVARSVAVTVPFDDRLAAVYAPTIEAVDHRRLGTWSARGIDAVLRNAASARAMGRDLVSLDEDVLALRSDACLVHRSHRGIADASGGAFEFSLLLLRTFGLDGRVTRFEVFDDGAETAALARFDELTAARARFAELASTAATERIENTATRTAERFAERWSALDTEGMAALLAPTFRNLDRRRLLVTDLDREGFLASYRPLIARAERVEIANELLATRGDRLALFRTCHVALYDEGIGAVEVAFLHLAEGDPIGRVVTSVIFDPDALDAAYAELDARYAAGEGAATPSVCAAWQRFADAFARRDWDAAAAQYAAALVVHDHRRLGWESIQGPEAYVASLRALAELAPDVRIQSDHVAMNERGLLWVGRWLGSREGGPFDSPWIVVSEHDATGCVLRFDTYDLDQEAAARARFAELGHDPLRIPPNAATRAADRIGALIGEGGWTALRALTAPDFAFDDRRKRALVSGDVELYVRHLQVVRSYPNLKTTRELLGTFGDRIAVARLAYSGGPEGSAFEGEFLLLTEVDAAGQVRTLIHFDPEDRAAAFAEAQARFVAGEAGGDEGQAAIAAFGGAIGRRDWKAVRDCCTDDFVTEDHRRLGLSSFGVDDYVQALRALTDLAPDVAPASHRILAWSRHGRVFLTRTVGTRDGGPFEHVTLIVAATRGARIRRIEVFEIGDAERALARFAELSAPG